MKLGKGASAQLLFGELNIEYAAQGPEAGDDNVTCLDLPLGVGTEEDLVAWARLLRTDDELFPKNEIIEGIWIKVLPTVDGRIPWEQENPGGLRVLLLEGKVPDDFFEDYDDDVPVTHYPLHMTH